MAQTTDTATKPLRAPAWLFIIGGVIGMIASFVLTYDKIHVLSNPDYQPSCNINPILSCGSVMQTEQASLLGVPNTIYGLVAFGLLTMLGLLLTWNVQLPKRFWLLAQIAAVGGIVFMHYLFFQGAFRINAICPWCFVVWMVTIPIFWYISLYNLQQNMARVPAKLKRAARFCLKHHGDILLVWYLVILGMLLVRFWYYWSTLL